MDIGAKLSKLSFLRDRVVRLLRDCELELVILRHCGEVERLHAGDSPFELEAPPEDDAQFALGMIIASAETVMVESTVAGGVTRQDPLNVYRLVNVEASDEDKTVELFEPNVDIAAERMLQMFFVQWIADTAERRAQREQQET